MLRICSGKEEIHIGFCDLGGFMIAHSYIKHVNLFHEPLIAVDRLLGVLGAMYNDKD